MRYRKGHVYTCTGTRRSPHNICFVHCYCAMYAAKRPDLDSKCTMAQEAGICDSHELKWFFNVTSNRCEAFNYTGCRGNYNRFNSKDECRRTCEPHHCEPARCKEKCMFGSVKDVNGCDTCHCINPCEVKYSPIHKAVAWSV